MTEIFQTKTEALAPLTVVSGLKSAPAGFRSLKALVNSSTPAHIQTDHDEAVLVSVVKYYIVTDEHGEFDPIEVITIGSKASAAESVVEDWWHESNCPEDAVFLVNVGGERFAVEVETITKFSAYLQDNAETTTENETSEVF